MNGYNIIIPDTCTRLSPEITLPVMDVLQDMGHTPVTMAMSSIHEMYHNMRYQRHGCYEIFRFYVRDLLKKGHIDFGFSTGLNIVLEDQEKQETHHLLEECGIPSLLYINSWSDDAAQELARLKVDAWSHTFIVATSEMFAARLRELGAGQVTASFPGASFRLFYPAGNRAANSAYRILEDDERLTSGFDVSFAGACDPLRVEYITALMDAGIKVAVFGDPDWKKSAAGSCWRNSVKYLSELNTVYNHSRINLDLPHEGCLYPDYISNRLFDCLAAGGFMTTNRRPAVGQVLEPEHDIMLYDDPAHLVKLVQYYLEHEEERQAILRRGHLRVLAECGWRERMTRLLPQMEMHLLTSAATR